MKKSIEERYKKLTQKEHVLSKPQMYIGSIINEIRDTYLVEDINSDVIKIDKKLINYNPGFFKLYDEILVNASDHYLRTKKVKYIKIHVNDDSICIENDGDGIPVEMHKYHKCYVPELIFGNLLSGENFGQDDKLEISGQNGIGSKAVNIFSKKFIVETADGKKKYKQEFLDNLNKICKPVISKSKSNYTKITYFPDFERFNLTKNTLEIQQIMFKRACDISAYCPNVKVYFNDKLIKIKSFVDYVKLYIGDDVEYFYEKLNDDWDICVTKSDEFKNISMVNGTFTLGGTHVDLVTNQIVNKIKENIIKKNKKINIKPIDIKNKLFIFLNSKVINPLFDSQTKEILKNKLNTDNIGNVEVSEKFIKKILQSDIVEDILNYIQVKEQAELKKLNKGKVSKVKIKKLDDANMAGTSQSEKTSLCITEGDCLQEDTEITIIREGEKINIKIKDVKLGDAVITHNNNIGLINNISKKIEKCVKIKLKNEEILICSDNHKWYVYDTEKNEFLFIETRLLNKNIHKMIINKNTFFDDFIKIIDIYEINQDKYHYMLKLSTGDVYSSKTHKFSVFDNIDFKFEMVECQNLDKNRHFIVSYEKL